MRLYILYKNESDFKATDNILQEVKLDIDVYCVSVALSMVDIYVLEHYFYCLTTCRFRWLTDINEIFQ